ncbi:MAG TPA: 2-oxoglutarate dehydrogenase complex dihydrolipoyllysine-residue succinyltransferase, partial [Rudaea sp.]|nr:2-oxoglutarate dehydrogenase complex dihydrolipoyllysine-residue succinyltransferase [Rudaea sp.]
MALEVKVPVLPESVSDATIASWHKKPGDAVKRDENLVDLETDKVVLEVPAPADGVLKEIKQQTGATVTSQQLLAIIEEGASAAAAAPASAPAKTETTKAAPAPAPAPTASPASRAPSPATNDLSPAAQRVASENRIDPEQVAGTGRGGQVTKEDLVNFMRSGGTTSTGTRTAAKAIPDSQFAIPGSARPEERVPMTRMRAKIAERLMQSKNSIAMLTSFNEVNLGKVVVMRKELGEQFEKANGIKLGYMSFFVKAACEALKRYPVVNASVDGNDVIYHGYQDISVAVSTDRGLVTPVLRDAQNMSFAEIEKAIANYAKAAREGGLKLEDLQGGTFTITNGGTFGSLFSTPIVNPPQSAILGMHTIKERAMVENGQVVA